MSVAQRLYENGHITYMRTDSTTLSQSAITAARTQAAQLYGEEYVHPSPRQYTRKVKNAQGGPRGHPAGRRHLRHPGALHRELDGDEFRLYELIWQRTVASQMADARGTTLSLGGSPGPPPTARPPSASGRTITFPGFLKAYVETVDELAGGEADDAESRLPELRQGQRVVRQPADRRRAHHQPAGPLHRGLADQGPRGTRYRPPVDVPRRSSRPSQDRGYVHKKGSALVPSWVAFAVTGLLEQHFGRLVDYDFTAAMEDDELDEIANGHERRAQRLSNFYFGGEHGWRTPSPAPVGQEAGQGRTSKVSTPGKSTPSNCSTTSTPRSIVVRVGKNGPYSADDHRRRP